MHGRIGAVISLALRICALSPPVDTYILYHRLIDGLLGDGIVEWTCTTLLIAVLTRLGPTADRQHAYSVQFDVVPTGDDRLTRHVRRR